jgi:hypothetical protein
MEPLPGSSCRRWLSGCGPMPAPERNLQLRTRSQRAGCRRQHFGRMAVGVVTVAAKWQARLPAGGDRSIASENGSGVHSLQRQSPGGFQRKADPSPSASKLPASEVVNYRRSPVPKSWTQATQSLSSRCFAASDCGKQPFKTRIVPSRIEVRVVH